MKIILSAITLTSVVAFTPANAADEVQAMHARLTGSYGSSALGFSGALEVKNLGYNKNIIIDYKVPGGNFEDRQDITATYHSDTLPGQEAWTFSLNHHATGESPITSAPVEFKIKYEVNGQVFIDDNNGVNYSVAGNNPVMGAWWNVLQASTMTQYNFGENDTWGFYHNIYVKQMGSSQSVFIRYTTNGWATWQEAEGAFLFANGQGKDLYQVKLDGLTSSETAVEYAIRYTVDGQDHWDNNIGENYIVNKPSY